MDWRTGVAREVRAFLDKQGIDDVDPWEFATAWRARYQPAMQAIRAGGRDFVSLDVLHLENLRAVLAAYQLPPTSFTPEELWHLNTAWHRLDPWPDSTPPHRDQADLHHRSAVERKSRTAGQHGQAGWAAVGRGNRCRRHQGLQTAAGGVHVGGRAARPAAVGRDAGRRAQFRPM